MRAVGLGSLVAFALISAAAAAPAPSRLWSRDDSRSACEAAIRAAPLPGLTIAFDNAGDRIRRVGETGWATALGFSAKTDRGTVLHFTGFCEAVDGQDSKLVAIIERDGLDYLASNQGPRGASLLAKVRITAQESNDIGYLAAIKNENGFNVRDVLLDCRIGLRNGQSGGAYPAIYKEVIPVGATHQLRLKLPDRAASLACSIKDFFIVGPDEQRLIAELGAETGVHQYVKLRESALNLGTPITALVGPYIEFVREMRKWRKQRDDRQPPPLFTYDLKRSSVIPCQVC